DSVEPGANSRSNSRALRQISCPARAGTASTDHNQCRSAYLPKIQASEIKEPKMCPPGQGMPGRVYQIDAGWMGGAASTGYRGPFFKSVE
ncbi:MAG TPA: hypothetical protein VLJ17_17740, partial [Xanthobacteraceae bacterium]|nr:hypothetical protein [Xanthobacteraceae bacterium]